MCSVVVAGAAVGLKAKQQEQRLLDKQRNILAVAGLLQPRMLAEEVQQAFATRIEPRLLDLQSGEFLKQDPATFDRSQALRDNQMSIALTPAQDIAGIRRRANVVEIYLVRGDGGQINKVILPIYGSGLWSMMYAFVAIDTDGKTVRGITYYDHGETPGLGAKLRTLSGVINGSVNGYLMTKGSPLFVSLKGVLLPMIPMQLMACQEQH